MTAPAVAAERFGAACLIGAALGLCYGFLRPLRPKYTALSDLVFLLALFWGWLYLAFGVCRGAFRLPYLAGMALGGFCWELLPGRFLRSIFSTFWKILSQIWHFVLYPCKKICEILKKMIASGENGLQ